MSIEAAGVPGPAPRVLVVDDDRTMRMLAHAALAAAGFAVETADDGLAAHALVGVSRPDIILLDVDLPGIDGFAVCKQLRADPNTAEIPVCIMTGLDDLESIRRAYDAGATDFIVKPPRWVIVVQRLLMILRGSAAARELRRSESRLVEAQRIARLGWWECDPGSRTIRCSSEFHQIFGLPPEGFNATVEGLLESIHPEDRENIRPILESALAAGRDCSFDHRIAREDGTPGYVHQEVRFSPVPGAGRPSLIATVQDVSGQRRTEEQIRFLAYFDGLTGLPNQRQFRERAEQTLQTAQRYQRLAALLILDLDRFKRINDTLGHAAGDTLLREVSTRVQETLRRTDLVTHTSGQEVEQMIARLGGDEFIVLLPEITRAEDAARVARRIIESLVRPVVLGHQEFSVTGSIGIAIYPDDGEDVDGLLKNADAAMYHAKDQGRDNFQFYNESMNASAFKRLTLEVQLRHALERGEFELFYQPQVSLATGLIIGAEALVRWRHPETGLVPPGDFISIAEEMGLIVPLGEWVARTACEQAARWRDAGQPIRVAVNVSGLQFRNRDFPRVMSEILGQSGLEPHLLELELTETVLMTEVGPGIGILRQLRAMGLRVAVDDFGTGHSSLSYLKRLPVNTLKIDRSFLRGVPAEEDPTAITSAIISLAHHLRLEVIAEGVETVEQLQFIIGQDCTAAQGYLLGRPVPAAEFADPATWRMAQVLPGTAPPKQAGAGPG